VLSFDVSRVSALLVLRHTLLLGKLNSALLTKFFEVYQGLEHGGPEAALIPIPTAAEWRIISAYETLGRAVQVEPMKPMLKLESACVGLVL
jgi:hypothetical protein